MGTNTSHQSLFSNNNPLFSSIVTLYTLILLYFPQLFLKIIFSPLLISTLILLLFLLRVGASQQVLKQPPPSPPPLFSVINNSREGAFAPSHKLTQNDPDVIENQPPTEPGLEPKPRPELEPNMVGLVLMQEGAGEVKETQCNRAEAQLALEPGSIPEPEACDEGKSVNQCLGWAEPKPSFSSKSLLEWDVGAPLEVIYEAYEGEEEEGEEAQNDEFWRTTACCNKAGKIERYPSLSRYYPETDSDSGSDSDSEDEEREGLIEIALDYGFMDKRVINLMMKVAEKQEEFHFDDEDSLIEIDISSTKNMRHFAC